MVALAIASCRSAESIERKDAIRLRTFLLANHPAYRAAVAAERVAIAQIDAAAKDMPPDTAAFAAERLRQKVLIPKHTYKYLHDQLAAWTLSGMAEEQRRRTCAHLKASELGLLRFTTLLTAIRDAPERTHDAVVLAEVIHLAAAAKEHTLTRDEIAPMLEGPLSR